MLGGKLCIFLLENPLPSSPVEKAQPEKPTELGGLQAFA